MAENESRPTCCIVSACHLFLQTLDHQSPAPLNRPLSVQVFVFGSLPYSLLFIMPFKGFIQSGVYMKPGPGASLWARRGSEMYKGGPRDALGSIGVRKEGNSALGVFRSCGCHGEAFRATGCSASGCLFGETSGAKGPWLLAFRFGELLHARVPLMACGCCCWRL